MFSSVFFGDLSQNGIGNSNPKTITNDYSVPRGTMTRFLTRLDTDGLKFTRVADGGSFTIPDEAEVKMDEF